MPKDMGVTLVVVNFIFLSLAAVTLAARLYVRATRTVIGMDDYLLIAAMALFTVTCAMSTAGAFHGLGTHHYAKTVADMKDPMFYFTMWQLFYVTSTVPVKASICVSLLRITMNRAFRYILWSLIIISFISTVLACIVVWTTCRPFPFTWDKTIPGGKCSSLDMIIALSYVVSAVNIVTDWTCSVMPALVLWDVQMRTKLKISVCIILGMGGFASITTLIRLKTIPSYRNVDDFLYGICEIAIWSVLEVGLGIIAGSVATLKPLFNKIFGSTTDPNSYQNKYPTPRPHPGSYRLREISGKSGIETTIVSRVDVERDRSEGSDDETASQRRILGRAPEGITVTRDIQVTEGKRDDSTSRSDVERNVDRMT